MSLGEILDRTFHIYRTRFWLFLAVGAIPALVMRLIHIIDGAWIHVNNLVHHAKSVDYVWTLALTLGFYHVSSFLGLLIQPAYVKLTSHAVFDERGSIFSSLRFAGARWRTYLWAATLKWFTFLVGPELLVGGLTIGVFYLLNAAGEMDGAGGLAIGLTLALAIIACSALCLFMSAAFAFAIQCASLEKLTGYEAMRRSLILTRGSRRRIAFTWLAFFIFFWILGWGLQILVWWLANLLCTGGHLTAAVRIVYPPAIYTLATVLAAVTGPLYPIALTLFYYDQRIRHEGYDIERMMDAAGLNATATLPAANEPVKPVADEPMLPETVTPASAEEGLA
jgi:hypothetical protein